MVRKVIKWWAYWINCFACTVIPNTIYSFRYSLFCISNFGLQHSSQIIRIFHLLQLLNKRTQKYGTCPLATPFVYYSSSFSSLIFWCTLTLRCMRKMAVAKQFHASAFFFFFGEEFQASAIISLATTKSSFIISGTYSGTIFGLYHL